LENCIFCRIANHALPAKIVFEDETVLAFEDLNPQAPVHLLVIPRKHLPSLKEAAPGDEALLGHLLAVSAELARKRQVDANGYRTVINNGAWGGQTVFHLHVHLMGGRIFHWPPG
jgi:histidine triad (HIT) family protein